MIYHCLSLCSAESRNLQIVMSKTMRRTYKFVSVFNKTTIITGVASSLYFYV